MDMWIEQLLMGDTRMLAFIFFLTGIIVYLVDVKSFRQKPENQWETKVAQGIVYIYVIGGITTWAGLGVLGWIA